MKHITWIAACCAGMGLVPIQTQAQEGLSQPDSIYLFSYATTPDEGRSGLKTKRTEIRLEQRRRRMVQHRKRTRIREMRLWSMGRGKTDDKTRITP